MKNAFIQNQIRYLSTQPIISLLISIFLNILVHIIISFIYFNPVDFVLQLETAKAISQGQILYRDIDVIIVGNNILPRPQYPPLYLYTLAMLIKIVSVENFTWQTAKLFLVLINIIVGLLIYYLISCIFRTHPKRNLIALFAFNWYLLNPSTLGVVFGGYHENFMIMFTLGGFISLFQNKNKTAGFFFGLSLLVKPIAIIYMIPIILWGAKGQIRKSIETWITAGGVFFLGALPFLIIAPLEFINDVFLIHTIRPDPSMSIHSYLPLEISTGVIPFLIQGFALGIIILTIYMKFTNLFFNDILKIVLSIITLFLITNRLLYPHYIPFIFPFFTFTLIFLIFQDNHTQRSISIMGLLLGLILVYIGYISWSIIWVVESFNTFYTNPLFMVTAVICITGLFLICISSLVSIFAVQDKLKVTET